MPADCFGRFVIRARSPMLAVAALSAVAGCGGGGDGGITPPQCVVTAVSVTPATLDVVAGSTGTLTAAVTQTNCSNITTNWQTSNAGVATVSSTGVVTGVAAGGPVTITATANGTSGTAQVTVTPAQVPIATISLSETSTSVTIGQTRQLTATPRDGVGNALTGRDIAWSSSNNAITTVTATGLVVGVASGQATITAAAEGKSATAVVTVSSQPVASVAVTPNGATLQPGATLQLSALTREAGGSVLTGRPVTWTTSSASIASVTSTGLVTAVAPGAVTITATSEGVEGTAIIVTAGASGNRFGFAMANQSSAPSYTPSIADQFASGGAPITITRQSAGVYDVLFPNMTKAAWQREVVLVQPGSGDNVHCQSGGWNPGSGGLVARVYCFSSTNLAVDGQFNIQLIESGTLAGRLGFTWADQPGTQSYNPHPLWSENSSGGAITITRNGTGSYTVRWAGLARTGGALDETVIVGAYGPTPRRCNVDIWDTFTPPDFVATITCTDMNGVAADSRFVAMIADRGRVGKRYGLTWANSPSTPIYTTTNNGYSRTSTAGAISIQRVTTGRYEVRLGGQARAGSPETVMVNAYGSTAMCKASQWATNGSDMLVTVLCFDPAGAAVDSRFDVLLVE